MLNLESQACFVPDEAYVLLDRVVGEVIRRVTAATPPGEGQREKALRVSGVTGTVLAENGFGLYIPTETLSDALHNRAAQGQAPRRIVDCDTGSMILLTVAQNLGMRADLVDITLPSGSGHNYVRWDLGAGQYLDWDTNGRAPCTTPDNLPSYQGRAMTRDETMSYILTLRAAIWEHRRSFRQAVDDYERAVTLAPGRPTAMNNLSWMISTRDFAGRGDYRQQALTMAQQAIQLNRIPNYLDTLACAYALNGDFSNARLAQQEAVNGDPGNAGFERRRQKFMAQTPTDCTGEP